MGGAAGIDLPLLVVTLSPFKEKRCKENRKERIEQKNTFPGRTLNKTKEAWMEEAPREGEIKEKRKWKQSTHTHSEKTPEDQTRREKWSRKPFSG